jgi:hypothetical protein
MAEHNVQISLALFWQISGFFECLSLTDQTFPALYDFDGILLELRKKQNKLNQQALFTKAVYTKDETQKSQAFKDYKKIRQQKF